MNVYNSLSDLPNFKNAVLTIGSFDGVHAGHQKILERINQLAKKNEGKSIVITFHPHPRQIIYPNDKSLRLLNSIDEKVALFEKYGIDNVVVVPFTVEFSQQSADEYIQKFLLEKFNPKYIVIGYDHKFGLNRQGDINYLKSYSRKKEFEVIEISRHDIQNIGISSTKIRNFLSEGDVSQANKLLNHNYSINGTVVHGQGIGKDLGYPTANIRVKNSFKLVPLGGIYAVQVIYRDQRYGGMLYIGDRPTLTQHNNQTIEVNIFDFNKDIYGEKLTIEFIDHIRGDEKFEDLNGLKSQLAKDKISSQNILKKQKTTTVELINPQEESIVASVAIVILNFNGVDFLKKFLPSVLKSEYEKLSIHVADNGSSDTSIAFLKTTFPEVNIIDLKGNHGFAKGYNLALNQVEADYLVLLNSDVEVTPNWINPIIDLMERDNTIGACQPKIKSYHAKDYFEYAGASGGWIDHLGYPFCRGRIFDKLEKDQGQYNTTSEIFWASGAAFFVRGKLFKAIGGFDSDYFAHAEEIDLCWRIKRAGFKVMVKPRSEVFHVGGGTLDYTNPRKTYLNFRNTLFTILKNEPKRKLFWLIPTRLILDGIAGGLFLFQGKFAHIKSILRAHFSFYSSFSTMVKKRKIYTEKIQKVSISTKPNKIGIYQGSMVWQYYIKKVKFFKNLK
ncbi:MAG: bifunctional riboflavin kinase/FAD synthetase [Saprospiraceae bacterium]|nr:bifunctional riboflavin kinase/FAD synthetase [Saprospiraceae bacterium]